MGGPGGSTHLHFYRRFLPPPFYRSTPRFLLLCPFSLFQSVTRSSALARLETRQPAQTDP